MNSGEKGSRLLSVSGGHPSPPLKGQEGIFHSVSPLIERFIIGPLNEAMLPREKHRGHALLPGLLKHGLAVIASVGQQIIRLEAFNQASGLSTLGLSPSGDKGFEGSPLRVHGKVDFRVEPPWVRLIA